jgi:hypothetical protein
MSPRLQSSDARVLLLWAVITAAMFAVLDLLIVHINIEPPEAAGQISISVISVFVIGAICCSVIALVIGLPLVASTGTGMRTGPSAAAVHGALLGSASAAAWMIVFFSGSISSVLIVLLFGAVCGACAGVISGRTMVQVT